MEFSTMIGTLQFGELNVLTLVGIKYLVFIIFILADIPKLSYSIAT
jgi:hypothetical protein